MISIAKSGETGKVSLPVEANLTQGPAIKRYPVIQEINTPLLPIELFESFRQGRFSFLLDSGMDPCHLGRYTIMGCDPFLVLRSRGTRIELITDAGIAVKEGNPFDVLGEMLSRYSLEEGFLPLAGGVVGYFSYDLCHFIERLPSAAVDDLALPGCYLGFYDLVLVYDHLAGKAYIVSTGFPETDESRRLDMARERLAEARSGIGSLPLRSRGMGAKMAGALLKSNFTHEGYLKAVAAAREYVCAGDIFQVNLSQRFETDLKVPPFDLYRILRKINPAPFASYLDFDGVKVVGASPERFLKVCGDLVETRPIKGTRPRGRTPEADRSLAAELVSSAKDRAENTMIVDLERNDLGRVCRYGTVKVTEWAALETFPTVFHLTSTVQGRLCPGKSRIDLLKATFPGGSVTGAPKVRAMEIIDELEPTRRSVYTGSVGYLSFGGSMDLNIVIRTILVTGGKAYFQVGGGIVYDSVPEAEYQETLDKARALIQALSGVPDGVVQVVA